MQLTKTWRLAPDPEDRGRETTWQHHNTEKRMK